MSDDVLEFPLREAPLLLVSELAVLFEKPRRTMQRDIESLEPDGSKNGRPAWRARSVLDHLLERRFEEFTGDPDKLAPNLRARHYDAEFKKARLAELRGEYLDREEVVAALAHASKLLADALEAIPDRASRELKMGRTQVKPLERLIDEARANFVARLEEQFGE